MNDVTQMWMSARKEVVRIVLCATMFGILGLAACGGGGGGGVSGNQSSLPLVVTVSPSKGQSLSPGQSLNLTAQVFRDNLGSGVTWSLSGSGVLINPTPFSVTYVAPTVGLTNIPAVITATSVASSTAFGYVPLTVVPVGVFSNVQPVNVDGGPVAGQVYPNGGFTSVTVCVPGTLTCSTVDGILVDTGSSGLRVLASALPSLPALTDGRGNSVNECVQFPDQSYIWGQVALADVRIAGEVASEISIHTIADPTNLTIPSDCSTHGAGIDEDTQQALGVNGILGVGLEPQDCGAACDPSAGGVPPGPAYYACSSNSCSPAFVPLAQQVSHPAVFFTKDNNGVELTFPASAGANGILSGSLIFGIGTRTNNVLGNASVFTVDQNDHFITSLADTGQSLTASFIDSGSNRLIFPDGNLPTCPSPESDFYCPAALTPMAAVNTGANSQQSTIDFSVDNAQTLLANSSTDAAISTLAGSNGAGACSGGEGACSFDWGLPFFFGRGVFTSIRGQTVPADIPAAPWWAYTIGFSKQ